MARKKMSKQGKILLGVVTLSVGMFGYSNIYLPQVEMKKEGLVYVAREDIPAYTEINSSMFQAQPVNKQSIVQGSVTDIATVQGKQLSGSLNKGEQLFDSRLTTDEVPEGELLTEVKIESKLPLKDNDNIRLYVKSKTKGNLFVVEELFKSKKVYTKNSIMGITEDGTQQQSSKGMEFYLKLSQDEVLKYEESVSTGEIVAVKLLGDEEVSKNVTNNEQQTKLVSDKQPMKDEASRGSVEYTVKEGETLADVADKFVTTEDRISELNDGVSEINAGDKILVPAI